ncbi:cytochrome c biogenesis protein CcmG, thiol:disulfide interchange protein DsbE [Aliiroseovarius sediminilitoris]|uniref:Cytochrome c biogenesis protein CcmG, thiol:disulfide interchange protein DsbE n=1 Tax=Aliiroseovarius sediminilitoris TaxID=1173584 RepID=A0A1I0NHS4_9RHOB|nr:DsbE family thiol:disulfide interchange protein [Aliiroseovarius sediminilitoris]SEW01040.1 cytochrome c biogenesis protein CcmG, thiol:disulfide interchange protein DsbE [Aliiroseovarius sediminilitoris]
MTQENTKFPIYYALPLVIVMGIVLLGGWKMFFDSGNDTLPSTREGGVAPSVVRLSAFDGAEGFTHDDLKSAGVKLVNFWASWCAPCRAEHPQLQTLADEGVVINGINYKDDPVNARRFLEELGDPFAKLMADTEGRTGLEWGLYGLPETFIIAADGTVVKRFAGPITESILESVIRPAIDDAASR